jgi:hypothetical protein
MAQPNPLEILNRLYALHSCSLPRYLASAPPWSPPLSDAAALTALRHIAEDQQVMADRIGAVILEHGGTVLSGEFPMEFTDMHDLSLDYVMPQVKARQEREIEFIRRCIQALEHAPAARAIAEEALGAAIAHLDNLSDLQRPALGIAG